jgi:hypothetical protein
VKTLLFAVRMHRMAAVTVAAWEVVDTGPLVKIALGVG